MNDLKIIEKGSNNVINIDSGSIFKNSIIDIEGSNCSIVIEKCTKIDGLNIKLVGNNKSIFIAKSSKKIRNIKFVSIRGDNQKLTIGESFGCGGVEIQMNDGDENCTIGADCLFSWGIKIRTSDGHSIVDLSTNKAVNLPLDVLIGDHVWIGEDAKLLKGSVIQSNSVVATSSVVTKGFAESNVVVAGIPAKIVTRGITWDRRMPREYNLDNSED